MKNLSYLTRFLIIDNNNYNRSTIVLDDTKEQALSKGSSILKTTSVRAIVVDDLTNGTINSLGFTI